MASCGCDAAGPQGKGSRSLIPYEDALDQLLARAQRIGETESVRLTEALGRVLAEDVSSAIDVPPAANSAMDGYAIRLDDVQPGGETRLRVTQRIPAGEVGEPIEPGTAARIFTGAPVPPNADAVIMQEQVCTDGDEMFFTAEVSAGQNIRAAGEDIRAGQVILEAGTRLRAQELGLAASVGRDRLQVCRRPRVGIFFTGDELVEPGKPLGPGQIHDSNRYTLTGLLQMLGCEIVDLGIVGDTLGQTLEALQKASARTDLVITSGGVSVGEEDYVRIALEQLGELDMWRIRIKPGKPLAFGFVGDTAFLGLPGNPVSVFATFCLFVAPFIKQLTGAREVLAEPFTVSAAFDWPKPDSRREFARARLIREADGGLAAELYPNQSSGVLMSTCWADGLVEIPEETSVKPGDPVRYYAFRDLIA